MILKRNLRKLHLLIFLGVTWYHKSLLKDVNELKLLPAPKVNVINKNNISKKQEFLYSIRQVMVMKIHMLLLEATIGSSIQLWNTKVFEGTQ